MKWYRIKAVIWRHIYEAKHNGDRMVDMAYWPILDVVLWGLISLYVFKNAEVNLVSVFLGAVIVWGIFYSFQRDIGVGFLDELWSRNLLNLFSSPLTVWEYTTGLLVITVIKASVGFTLASLVAWLLYHYSIFQLSYLFLPFLANIIIFSTAIGFFITGLIFRYTTKIQTLAWSFAGILQALSCVFYPLAILPPGLQVVAWLLPTAHAFEGMRQILRGGGFSAVHFWWGFGYAVLYLVGALVFFKHIFEIARKRGLLVRLT